MDPTGAAAITTPTPSKLHLRKKIRKAARLLRDPGTSSSWKRSPSPSLSKSILNPNNNPTRNMNVYLHNWDKPRLPLPNPTKHQHHHANDDVDVDVDSLSDSRNCSTNTNNRKNSISAKYKARNDTNLIPPIPTTRTRTWTKTTSTSHHHHFYSEDDDNDDDDDDDARHEIALTLPVKTNRRIVNNSSKNNKDDSSSYTYTPALSTSSFTKNILKHNHNRNPTTTLASWDATTTSLNDDDLDLDDDPLDHLPAGQGCGIPCYWSRSTRTPRLNRHHHRLRLRDNRSCSSTYTPSAASASPSLSVSLSDTFRRKGATMLCGSQSVYAAHRRSSKFSRRRLASKTAQGVLPLLADIDRQPLSPASDDDDLSTNFGELDLEALSRLDGRRWSNCRRSHEAEDTIDAMPGSSRSLSHKYKPLFFHQVIGQNIVCQSLVNAISRGRIAPVYLFQGPRGTGKTSTARVFAAALNCLSTEDTVPKPCGFCKECTDFFSGKSKDLWEVNATNRKGLDRVRYLIKNLSARPPLSASSFSPYKVFIIDECHLLPSKTWLTFLKFIEDPPQRVVFIFTTTDLDNVPRTVQSRCQKYLFNKIKDSDVVARLRSIAAEENLDVEPNALDLIALNADGSLRDAETMLDQLSLLGKRVTTSLVNELVGVVSDEKLLDLLELAMSSDTAETVKRARELMDSGVDPLVLMSQLASLIMDIIAGTYKIVNSNSKSSRSFLEGRALSEAEVDRLKHALKLLSEAEKHLRVSSERSTWFTATLLQLGSVPSPEVSLSTSSRRQSSKTTDDLPSCASRGYASYKPKSDAHFASPELNSPTFLKMVSRISSRQGITLSKIEDVSSNSMALRGENLNSCSSATSHDDTVRNSIFEFINSGELDSIWAQCIQRCHSKTLRRLLRAHGKLISISEAEGILVVYIAFVDKDVKSRAERFFISIRNSVEVVLRRNVEVRIILLPDCEDLLRNPSEQLSLSQKLTALALQKLSSGCAEEGTQEPAKVSRESLDNAESIARVGMVDNPRNSPLLDGTQQSTGSLSGSMAEDQKLTIERRQELPMHRIESIIQEQRLETAWLQAADKGTPRSLTRLKPEKNQVLPQDGMSDHHHLESRNSTVFSSQNWEDELNRETRVLKIADGRAPQKDVIGKTHYPMSPSLLHDSNFMGNSNKENLIYESGSGTEACGALFCWNRPRKSEKRQRAAIRARRSRRSIMFGYCAKPKSERRCRGQSS